MEQLIGRKRALLADDERLIGTWKVTRTEDGIKTWSPGQLARGKENRWPQAKSEKWRVPTVVKIVAVGRLQKQENSTGRHRCARHAAAKRCK